MAWFATAEQGPLVLVAYRGDAKTLLAWDLRTKKSRYELAGFTIRAQPPHGPAYFLRNALTFACPADHHQDPTEPAASSVNSPFHEFRWVHDAGLYHQDLVPEFGLYTYTVTPRYFLDGSLQAIDPSLGATVSIDLQPFVKGRLRIGFTRGFVQSQAYVDNFGPKAVIEPDHHELLWDTSQHAGVNGKGDPFTYEDQYVFLGGTARKLVLDLLQEVRDDASLTLDVFAFDLKDPAVAGYLLDPEVASRTRVVLDDSATHHVDLAKAKVAAKKKADAANAKAAAAALAAGGPPPKPKKPTQVRSAVEDIFADQFAKAGGKELVRGCFGRYAHDKVLIVSKGGKALRVLTGSTNFSITGFAVNANHVLIYDDPTIAALYQRVFEQVRTTKAMAPPFRTSEFATNEFSFATKEVPRTAINFAPHTAADARVGLDKVVARVDTEVSTVPAKRRSVLFAVMELDTGKNTAAEAKESNPVYYQLNQIHQDPGVFSYGISDNPEGVTLYRISDPHGVLVTGKPEHVRMPPPFSQVPTIGLGHQIHHKFVVCGFNRADATVFCGSSNLALTGEQMNGDNLLRIDDRDVATAFAIEALLLVDHFNFLDKQAHPDDGKKGPAKAATPRKPKTDRLGLPCHEGWALGFTPAWADKFFNPADLRSRDRELFAYPDPT